MIKLFFVLHNLPFPVSLVRILAVQEDANLLDMAVCTLLLAKCVFLLNYYICSVCIE